MQRMKVFWAGLVVFAVLLASIPVAEAGSRGGFSGHRGGHFHHRGGHFHPGFRSRVFIGVGVAPFVAAPFFWGPAYWGPTYSYAYPSYAYAPPVYAPPAYAAPPPQYWYYCPSAGGYYPTVPSCPEPWVPVPPR
jgi:hypothetical protein